MISGARPTVTDSTASADGYPRFGRSRRLDILTNRKTASMHTIGIKATGNSGISTSTAILTNAELVWFAPSCTISVTL